MHTKLTLRVDNELVDTAKVEASRRGKSVSQMVGEFFDSLTKQRGGHKNAPPVTASLVGVLKSANASESAYKKHLREKYL